MRKLYRLSLSRKALVWLSLQTREVLTAGDPKKKADELWRTTRRHRYRKEVYETLLRMTSGVGRCMYCEDSAGHALEHSWPKSKYPERTFCWQNILIVCAKCNGYKLAQFPLDERGEPLLIDPTAEDPAHHLVLSPRQGEMLVRNGSPKGHATCVVLKLNRWELVQGRQNAWVGLQGLLVRYQELRAAGQHDRAERVERAIRAMPFSVLLHSILQVLELPDPKPYLDDPDRLDVLRSAAPELRAWLAASLTDVP